MAWVARWGGDEFEPVKWKHKITTSFIRSVSTNNNMSNSNNALIPRTGLPVRISEGPKVGQRSLYRQQVLDVSQLQSTV